MFSGTAAAVVVLTGERALFGHISESIAVRGPASDFEAGRAEPHRPGGC